MTNVDDQVNNLQIVLCNRHFQVVRLKMENIINCHAVTWRWLVLSDATHKKVVITMSQQLLSEVDGVIQQEQLDLDEFISQATKMYLHERKKRHIREAMRQGYMEMAKINLNIASEAFLAEEEADDTLDRLVSGV